MKPIAHMLAELRDLRVRLWIENGELRYRVPRGTLVPEQLAQIRARKDEILAFLRESGTAPGALIAPRVPAAAAARLSSAQRRLWVLDQLDGASATYNIPLARRLRGPFDKAAFIRAVSMVSRRHETLRTHVDIEEGVPRQRIAASVAVPWRDIDLSDLPEAARLQRATALAAEEADLPFDLKTGPLLRIVLLRLADEDHLLVLTLHHFIADGWSMRVLSKELSAFYAAALGGHSPELPALPLQYADYAEWEHAAGEEAAATTAFWTKQLAGAPPLLQFFPNRPRPPVQGYRGETLGFRIEAGPATAIKRIAQEAGVSLFMALFALFLVLVRRYTGRDDLVIGTPVANRDRRELEPLIGFFSNYLVLRVDCAGDPSFNSLLARVRQVALAAYAHQAISFDKVVEALDIARDPSFTPLVQIMFLLHVPDMDQLSLPGVAIAHFDMPVRTAKCDFTLAMEEAADGFVGTAIYNRDLFSRDEVQRLIGHFATLLDSVVARPECPISQLDMLKAEERVALVAFARGPAVEFDAELRLDQAFADTACKYPERLAVIDGTQALSYGELAARSGRLARSLRGCGAGPGRIVGVCLDRSVDLIVAIIAILRAGAAYLPLDPDHAGERQAAIIKDADVQLLVTSRAHRDVFKATAVAVLCVDEPWPQSTQASSYSEPGAPATSRDLAYVIYTSGSTGRPRGVAIEHHSVVNLVAALDAAIYRTLPDALQVGLLASVAFDASVQQIFAALIGGHTLHLVDATTRRDADRLLDWLAQRRIDVVDITPSLLAPLIEASLAIRQDLALRHVIVGGEALPRSLATAFFEGDLRGRCRLSNIYGPTECCVDATILTLEAPPPASSSVLPIGRPLGNLRVHILDPEGHPVPIGVAGEIWLAGPCVGRGYLGLPELTAEKFIPLHELGEVRAYRTGDYGAWTEAGLIEFFGRCDDQVKIRGHRVELGEIDAALAGHPQVSGVATLVHQPPGGAPELASYVALRGAAPTAAALRQWLATKLPSYMLPSRILLVETLPLTVGGKVDRAALPPIGPAAKSDTAFRAPETVQETILAEVWQGVLRLPAIGADDRFFDLGGDSIKALQIIARLRAAGWQIDIRALFEHPTIGELAPRLQAIATTSPRVSAVATDDIPLMPIQRWFLACFDGALTHFNQTILLHPTQSLNATALTAALRAVVLHHDALRARFERRSNGWRQWIGPIEEIVVAEIDLRGAADPATALAEAATHIQADCDLAAGRLFRAARFYLPDGDRLLLTAHHLIVDGVSWRILLDDLALAYEQAAAGRTIALAPSDSFAAWASRLVDYASGAVLAERDYWRTCSATNASACLPIVSPRVAPARLGESSMVRIALPRDATAALIGEANLPYRTEVNDLLLTALARAVAGIWLPQSTGICVNIMVEGHGREHLFPNVELSRAIGWFTCEYPLCLRLPAAAPLGRQIIEVKETLRGVPHHGIGYGILRYLTPVEIGLGPAPAEPRISFNYLGSFDANFASGLFRLANESAGAGRDPDATMRHDIDVVGMVRDGALQFELGYSPARIEPAVMERLASAYQAELEGIIAHALTTDDSGPTPSDLDVPGLEIDTLSEFLQTLGS